MNGQVKEIICLTENFPDGQKITGARVVYDRAVDGEKLSAGAFSVDGRTVTGVRADGCAVDIALDARDEGAALIPAPKHPPRPKGEKPKIPMGPPHDMPPAVRLPVRVSVAQTGDVFACDGSILRSSDEPMISTRAVEPVVEDFEQGEFAGLKYSLFTPKLEEGKKYPLVVFIHDAGVCGDDGKITLSQGNGAVTWATPLWQQKHPCFVLAPQIPRSVHLTNDDFTVSDEIHTIKALIDRVAATPAVDTRRIYTTGQSMGCMASCELSILHPDYFAAAMLVAGQWSPERMAASCAMGRFWILVSQHDAKAFPGMNAMTEAMEGAGAKVARYVWCGKSTSAEFAALTDKALADDANVRYTVFEGSSVVPEGVDDDPGSNHVSTWPVAYGIDGVKEWLFAQVKEGAV